MRHNLPDTSLPWENVRKSRRKKYIAAGLFLGVIAAYYLSLHFISLREENEMVRVVRSRESISAGQQIVREQLEEIMMPNKYAPESVLRKISDIERMVALRDIPANSIIVSTDARVSANPKSVTSLIPAGKHLFMLPESWLEAPLPELGKNDRVNVLAFNTRESKPTTRTIASQLQVAEVTQKSSQKILALYATEAEAQNLLAARAFRLPMTLLIHAP